jgi:hypothetical protein
MRDEGAEIVSGSGKDGVGGVACAVGAIVSVHAVLCLEVPDDGFDGGGASHLAFAFGVMCRFWSAMKTPNVYPTATPSSAPSPTRAALRGESRSHDCPEECVLVSARARAAPDLLEYA